MATITEAIEFGEIKAVGRYTIGTYYDSTAEQILAEEQRKYAGAALLRPTDEVPPNVGPIRWATRVYNAPPKTGWDRIACKEIYPTPDLWLLTWTDEATEAAQRADHGPKVVPFDEFQARRHGSPVVEG